jgi:hypothetical protein
MEFNEALESTMPGTESSDVKGIKKRVGPIVTRKLPAGYEKYTKNSKEWKKLRKKWRDEEDEEKNEGRVMTRYQRPSFSGNDMRDFWKSDDKLEKEKRKKTKKDKDSEKDDDEKELQELLMQLSGEFDYLRMDPFWKGKSIEAKRAIRDKKKKKDYEYYDDEEEDDEEIDEMAKPTKYVDPNYLTKAVKPFWEKEDDVEEIDYDDFDEYRDFAEKGIDDEDES